MVKLVTKRRAENVFGTLETMDMFGYIKGFFFVL